ncbi:MAG: ester cyclase [Anaerolineae bacterium]|nr:ester cyclase [Anaerolineae bacterium]
MSNNGNGGLANKQALFAHMQKLVDVPDKQLNKVVAQAYHSDAVWNGSHPLDEIVGAENIDRQVWRPLRRALPDIERRDDILLGGHYNDADWVGAVGNYIGTFENEWLGIPPTHGMIYLRYGEYHRLVAGKIAQSYIILDFLDLMRQTGFWPIAPSLGTEGRWLGPQTHDGVLLSQQDPVTSKKSIQATLNMHQGLFHYDHTPPTRAVLDKMKMVEYWHPHMMWYGPSGIGTTRGLKGFEDFHQIPFLVAFPDREGAPKPGGHYVRIGDGNYAGTGGWPSLKATHTGGNWLGLPPTSKSIAMRTMDFYRIEADKIVENWVPIDIIHILLQLGIDVFGRIRSQFRNSESVSDWLVNNQSSK